MDLNVVISVAVWRSKIEATDFFSLSLVSCLACLAKCRSHYFLIQKSIGNYVYTKTNKMPSISFHLVECALYATVTILSIFSYAFSKMKLSREKTQSKSNKSWTANKFNKFIWIAWDFFLHLSLSLALIAFKIPVTTGQIKYCLLFYG